MLSLAVVALCPLLTAQAEPVVGRAAVMPRVSARTSSVSGPLTAALEELPDTTALAVVLTDPARVFQEAEALARELGVALPEVPVERWLTALRAEAMWGGAPPPGVDLHGRATWVVGLGGAPHVLRLSLGDASALMAWARDRGATAVATWGDDPVWALGEAGLACVVRGAALWCQLGPSGPADRLSELRRVVDVPVRRLAQSSAMSAAAARVPAAASLYVLGRPGALAEAGAAALIERARGARPFAAHEERRRLDDAARMRARQLIHAGTLARGAVTAVTLSRGGVEARTELALSERGADVARQLARNFDAPDPILGWAETPSLARVVARLEPRFAAELLAWARVPIPAQRLSGTVAVMMLGLDTACPAAKASGPRELEAWPFVFPLAGAIGLAGAPIDLPQLMVSAGVPGAPPPEESSGDVAFRGRLHGSPVEVRLAPGIALVGTGHGAGSAAARRWSSARPAPSSAAGTFFDARVDLAAIGVALGAGAYDGETRPELRRLEHLYRRVAPLVARYPRARATSQVSDGGRMLTISLSVGP